ncbi:MAG: HipA domain-containing protein [Crocinitomicaceae bacterium]
MSLPEIKYDPGTLKEGYDSYSPATLRHVFDGKKVSHILPYDAPKKNEETNEEFLKNRNRFSISGVQEKLSIIQDKNKLRLTKEGEQGTHILKPIPIDLRKVSDVPANEHLTMQIAEQIFDINTASNALIFFQSGEPAYITKRFDVKKEGGKWGKEDFASLAGKSVENAGDNFKYDYDYVQLGKLIEQYIPAWRIEIEKYFSVVLFNYLISNGDAHLKNFAVLETLNGDHILSPMYDLLNTRIHVDDPAFALTGGLLPDKMRSVNYKRTGVPTRTDFVNFGKEIGVSEKRIDKIISPFAESQSQVLELINNSYLSAASKNGYTIHYNTRRKQFE